MNDIATIILITVGIVILISFAALITAIVLPQVFYYIAFGLGSILSITRPMRSRIYRSTFVAPPTYNPRHRKEGKR